MLPYWLLFLVPAALAATPPRLGTAPLQRWSSLWRAVFVLLVLAIGLRHEVGGDWSAYVGQIYAAADLTFAEAALTGDVAYGALNWVSAYMNAGPYFVNTLCAGVFAGGLLVFCRAQPRPWLALLVAMPYLVTVVAMGYTRQGVAVGLAMVALVALAEQRILRFVVFVVLAALFHKSAVMLMPLAILGASHKRLWTALWVGLASALFYGLLLQESVEALRTNYLEAEYASSGAALRVAMNAVPAVLFLMLRQRFDMPPPERSFWTWMSLGALAFLVLLVLSPSSTAVDRMALYWIPLQLLILSRLPNALGNRRGRNHFWVCLVVVYSATVLFVWLTFADHAFAWLPYQFYPFVLLFG